MSNNIKLETTKTEIPNPYHPYDFEWGTWFKHDQVLQNIKKQFETHEENKTILVHGRLGAEKTRILKKIGNSPGDIGKNYIPIYLDLRGFMEYESHELLFFLAKEVIRILSIRGHAIPEEIMASYSDKKNLNSDLTVTKTLLTIDAYLENRVLLLVLDEFDELLKRIGTETISQYIQYFMYLEKSWTNYALIIGVKNLHEIRYSIAIKKFLDSVFKIDLGEYILTKKDLEKFISPPIENDLIFSLNAIKKITWYSGKNLYFQQLICYFLVHYIDEKEKSHCAAEDVENVIPLILADQNQKDQFNQNWANELSVEMRVLASALADEKKTMNNLTENELLGAILGGKIFKKVKELINIGYINETDGKNISDFSFKIPIYGLFIQKYHPFIKTVVENIDAIADRIDFTLLIHEAVSAPKDQLSLFDKDAIVHVADEWVSLRTGILDKNRAPTKLEIERFLKGLSNLLSLKMPNNQQEQDDESHLRMDIKNLNIGSLEEAFCFLQTKPEIMESDIFYLENKAVTFAQDAKIKFTLFFYFQNSNLVDNLVKKTYLNLIAIDENDLKIILLSKRPQETFRKIILSRLSLQFISLYHISGPAKDTFYGRSEIINRIIGSPHTSFAIVGPRKIGKSSLLYKIKDNPPPGTTYIFMNLEVVFDREKHYNKFLHSLVEKIEETFNKKVSLKKFPFTFGSKIKKVREIIRELAMEGNKIKFIFDEIDALLELDKKNNYQMMRNFRSMSQDRYCQFIFAGFKELYNTKRHLENPMYNFCEEIILDPLDEEASLDLITKPMESIGIHYHKNEDRKLILEYTARHPNLMQFLCTQLVKKVEKHTDIEERRTIFKNDIEDVFNKEYQNYIMDKVYMFFSDLSPVNRLILIMLVESSSENRNFYINEIKGLFLDHQIDTDTISPNAIQRNLRDLVVRFILVDEGNNYRFALDKFPDILKEKIDIFSKDETIKEITSNVLKSG
jgi:hypothetical protein